MKRFLILLTLLFLGGCASLNLYEINKPLQNAIEVQNDFKINKSDSRGNKDVLVILALSGGGSRAAYFSAKVMLKLQDQFNVDTNRKIDILQEVDAISSVSGGSLAAAYYCASMNEDRYVSVRVFDNMKDREGLSEIGLVENKNYKYDEGKHLLSLKRKITQGQCDKLKEKFSGAMSKDAIQNLYKKLEAHDFKFKSKTEWKKENVEKALGSNFICPWVARWFYPWNFPLYLPFYNYTRNDLMAQVYAEKLFNEQFNWRYLWDLQDIVTGWGKGLKFKDLNPERPLLIMNATIATEDDPSGCKVETEWENHVCYGKRFTFTQKDFTNKLGADINTFPLAYAAMASSAFPGVFHYLNFRNYNQQPGKGNRFIHLYDGGLVDNLGLCTVEDLIKDNQDTYNKFVVILVDAFAKSNGVKDTKRDPRSFGDRIIDTNFMDSFSLFLENNRKKILDDFQVGPDGKGGINKMNKEKKDRVIFCHFTFEDLQNNHPKLYKHVREIPTSLTIDDQNKKYIDQAVEKLFDLKKEDLKKIRELLLDYRK